MPAKCLHTARAISQYKCRFSGIGVPIIKIRESQDRLIFIIGIHVLVRRHHYIETARDWHHVFNYHLADAYPNCCQPSLAAWYDSHSVYVYTYIYIYIYIYTFLIPILYFVCVCVCVSLFSITRPSTVVISSFGNAILFIIITYKQCFVTPIMVFEARRI